MRWGGGDGRGGEGEEGGLGGGEGAGVAAAGVDEGGGLGCNCGHAEDFGGVSLVLTIVLMVVLRVWWFLVLVVGLSAF